MSRSRYLNGYNPMRKSRNYAGIEWVRSIPTDELKKVRSKVSVRDMASYYSVSTSFLYNHLRKLGIKGVALGSSKLTESDVIKIRALKGKQFCSVVARQFQVDRVTIQAIWDGITWGWLKGTDDEKI